MVDSPVPYLLAGFLAGVLSSVVVVVLLRVWAW